MPHTYGFYPVVFNSNLPHSQMISLYGQGIQSQEEVEMQRDLFGTAAIEIKKPQPLTLLVDEVLTPFYLF